MAVIVKGKNPRKPHTVRYWIAGRQRERSFSTSREARDFKTKIEYEARTQVFTDPKLGSVRFTDYATAVIDGLAVSDSTRKAYRSVMVNWLTPWAGDRTLRQVADNRERAAELLNVATAAQIGYSRRNTIHAVLTLVMKEAVAAGRIDRHRLGGIVLIRTPGKDDQHNGSFVFPSYGQVSILAGKLAPYSLMIWLMRGCGLRIGEARAVHKQDFIEGGTVLRCQRQASLDGSRDMPLKHRKPGAYRDIPAPGYLWEMVRDLPDGILCPSTEHPYHTYSIVYHAFTKARDAAGIPEGFTPHSLRHVFASALLANGVPITDVSAWLGHKDINVTYAIYGHLIPSATARARSVLDAEFASWSETEA